MNEFYKSYYTRFAFLTLSLAILAFAVFSTFLSAYYFKAFPFLLVFIAGVNLIFHEVMMHFMRKNKKRFQAAFLTGTMAKLLIYLGAIVAYMLLIKMQIIAFVVTFVFLYIIYNAFETRYLVKKIKS